MQKFVLGKDNKPIENVDKYGNICRVLTTYGKIYFFIKYNLIAKVYSIDYELSVRPPKFQGHIYTTKNYEHISCLMPFNVIIRLAIKMYNFIKYDKWES